jgi:hypothetical protein
MALATDVAVETRLEPAPEAPPCEHGKAFTGDATPVEPGHVEVELAYAPTWWATAGAVDRQEGQQHQMGLGVGVGLLRDVDMRLVVSWAVVHAAPEAPGAPVHGSGLADTTVAARWRFLRLEEPSIDLAVSAAARATPPDRPFFLPVMLRMILMIETYRIGSSPASTFPSAHAGSGRFWRRI